MYNRSNQFKFAPLNMYDGANLYFGVMSIILSYRVQHDIATNILFNMADGNRNVMMNAKAVEASLKLLNKKT